MSLNMSLLLALLAQITPHHLPVDWRDIVRGGQLLSADPGEYYNQPQLVQLRNGSWSMVLTNAGFKEGQVNQRVVARLHRGADLRAGEWSAPVDIEAQPYGPSSGWVVPLYAPVLKNPRLTGRVRDGHISRMYRQRLLNHQKRKDAM